MASFKASELRSRLLGFLVEKLHLQVETVDVSAVLLAARERSVFSDRDAALKHLPEMRDRGLISAADIAQVTGTVTDAEFTMRPTVVDPFSERAS